MTTQNRNDAQAHDAQVIVGIHKDLSTVSALAFAGETFTAATLAALFQSRIDAIHAVTTAKANWQAAVANLGALDAKVTPVLQGLKQYVINTYGATSPVLADFGFTAPKRATQTPEQKAAAVAKRNATRKARHTMGPKAKLKVKGAVDAAAPAEGGTATTAAPAAPSPATPPAPPSVTKPAT
jgi:hypothetical protein